VNTYTGATAVDAGIFQVGVAGVGSTASGSAVTATSTTFTTPTTGAGVNASNVAVTGQEVVTGAPVIAGTGSILGNLTIGASSSSVGVIRPGDVSGSSNGTLNIGGNLVVNNGSQLQMGLTSTTQNDAAFNWYVPTGGQNALAYLTGVVSAGDYTTYWDSADGGYDSINVTGTLALGTGGASYPTLLASENGTFLYNKGDIFKLLNWSGIAFHDADAIGGTYSLPSDLVLPTLAAGYSWDTSAFSGFGVVVVIPEPGRMMLLFFGLAALFLRRRRK
jgi:fibronectin-binding autotransporter adhesin